MSDKKKPRPSYEVRQPLGGIDVSDHPEGWQGNLIQPRPIANEWRDSESGEKVEPPDWV